MTRKDYIALAGAIRDARRKCYHAPDQLPPTSSYVIEMVVGLVSDVLANDNPRFNRDTFVLATRYEV